MLNAIFTLFEIAFRRWYGGWWFCGDDNSFWNRRGFQTVINCTVLFCAFFFLAGVNWWQSLIIMGVLQFLYYAKGVGAFFDLGHAGQPDSELIERYKKQWGYKLVCKLFPERLWFTYWFDATLLLIRYTLPLVLLIWWKWYLPFLGLVAVMGYMLGWHLQDKGFKFLNNKFCDSATNFGEIATGLSVGLMLII